MQELRLFCRAHSLNYYKAMSLVRLIQLHRAKWFDFVSKALMADFTFQTNIKRSVRVQ